MKKQEIELNKGLIHTDSPNKKKGSLLYLGYSWKNSCKKVYISKAI